MRAAAGGLRAGRPYSHPDLQPYAPRLQPYVSQVVFGPGDPLFTEDLLYGALPPPLVGDGRVTYTPIYVKNLAGLLACAARRLLTERREATATTTATVTTAAAATTASVMRPPARTPPRQMLLGGPVLEAGDGDWREIGGAVLEAGDCHVSAAQLRALVLTCRAAPPWAWAPARLPLWAAWLLVGIAWLLDRLTRGRLSLRACRLVGLTPAALYYMAGADFAFGRSAYERLGYTPPHDWPHGVATDLRNHAAQRAAAAAAMPKLTPPNGVDALPKGVDALTKGVDALPFFDGATVVLTGGTAGLGVGLLDLLSRHCLRIYLVCRSRTKGEAARARCAALGARAQIELVEADLTSMAALALAARQIGADCVRHDVAIDALVHNAAMMAASGLSGGRALTAEGLETQFAANVCAPHLLTRLLLPSLATGTARVIITGSGAPRALSWRLDGPLQGEDGVGPAGGGQYCRTKLMVAMLGAELSRRRPTLPVLVWNPGATDSQMGDNVSPRLASVLKPLFRLFFRTPAQSAAFGLGAAGGAGAAVGYLSHGDLGQPDAATPPLPWDGVGGDMRADSPRGALLWAEIEAVLEGVLGSGVLPPTLHPLPPPAAAEQQQQQQQQQVQAQGQEQAQARLPLPRSPLRMAWLVGLLACLAWRWRDGFHVTAELEISAPHHAVWRRVHDMGQWSAWHSVFNVSIDGLPTEGTPLTLAPTLTLITLTLTPTLTLTLTLTLTSTLTRQAARHRVHVA